MIKYLYVQPDGEKLVKEEPLEGTQYITWYKARSRTSPLGYEYHDYILGDDVYIRSFDQDVLERFIRTAFRRTPKLEVRKIEEVSI